MRLMSVVTPLASLLVLACGVQGEASAASSTLESALTADLAGDALGAPHDPPDDASLSRDLSTIPPVGGLEGPPSHDDEFAEAIDAERRAIGLANAVADLEERARVRGLTVVEFVLDHLRADPANERGLIGSSSLLNGTFLTVDIIDITSSSCGHRRRILEGARYAAAGHIARDVLVVDDASNLVLIGGAP